MCLVLIMINRLCLGGCGKMLTVHTKPRQLLVGSGGTEVQSVFWLYNLSLGPLGIQCVCFHKRFDGVLCSLTIVYSGN